MGFCEGNGVCSSRRKRFNIGVHEIGDPFVDYIFFADVIRDLVKEMIPIPFPVPFH